MRALVVVPHFFNLGGYTALHFGSHQVSNLDSRKLTLSNSKISIIREFERMGINYDLVYLGIRGANLLDLQVETNPTDPRFLPWLAMDHAYSRMDVYDLVAVIEDDIEITSGTFASLIAFNAVDDLEVTLIPNRIETFNQKTYCTDLIAMPGWKAPEFDLLGLRVREPINIHSGLIMLSKGRFKKAYESRPFTVPTQIIGDFMASAFANMHAFQKIVRAGPTAESVTVLHRDNWAERMIELSILSEAEVNRRILRAESQ